MSPPPIFQENVSRGWSTRAATIQGFLNGPFFAFACAVVSFPGPPISCAFLFGLLKKTGKTDPSRVGTCRSAPYAGPSALHASTAAGAKLDLFILPRRRTKWTD